MYLMGNFAVDVMKNAGFEKKIQLGFMQFPANYPGHSDGRRRPHGHAAYSVQGPEQGRREEVLGLSREAGGSNRK